MKKLNELFNVDVTTPIYSLHNDSRYVLPYSVFFCVEGLTTDGHQYVDDAIFQGAKCIVHTSELTYYQDGVLYIKVDNVLNELRRVVNIFYDNPSEKLKIVGVTGTTGKTVIASLVDQVISKVTKTGYIGTLSLSYNGMHIQSPYTTPETLFITRYLDKMVNAGVEVVSMEASSHGLALERVEGIKFDVAVLSNISEGHLDFHGTMDEYVQAKLKLFKNLDSNGYAVVNGDDKIASDIIAITQANIITYGMNSSFDIYAKNIKLSLTYSSFDIVINENEYSVITQLVGNSSIYNILALVGVLKALQYSDQFIVEAIHQVDYVSGRNQIIDGPRGSVVLVDYCQSIQNYENVFSFVDKTRRDASRVIGVIGAPSRRSAISRKQLGKLAEQYLDHVILTEIDDRGQKVEDICAEIQEQLFNVRNVIIKERQEAVEQALEIVQKDDIILLLGKGHEEFIALKIGERPYIGDANMVYKKIEEIKYEDNEDELQYYD